MRILLDTAAIYVAVGKSELDFTPKVQRLLDDPNTERLISPLSMTEIAIKANKGLNRLTREDVVQAIDELQLTVLPFETSHAFHLFGLPLHHGDPFDRMLIATALAENVPIVANNRHFKSYKGLRVIW